MSTVAPLLDWRSCWQYLRNDHELLLGVYDVPFADGQPSIARAAAVVVGVLIEDVVLIEKEEGVEEVEVEDWDDEEDETGVLEV